MKKGIKIIISMLLVVGLVTGCGCKKQEKNKTEIQKDGTAKENTEVKEVTFSDIKLTYEGSITTLEAKMKNNTDKTKSFTVTIILKEKGKEVKKLQQIVENLTPEREQILQTGIVGDYSKIKEVEFEIEGEK